MSGFIIRSPDKIRILVPYNPDFVSELKNLVPAWQRGFDYDTKAWTVQGEHYSDAALELVAEMYGEVEFCGDQTYMDDAVARVQRLHTCPKPGPAAPHDTNECLRRVCHIHQELAALYLLPGAPWGVVHAAYRALAKILHPDTGNGSTRAMADVNRAYETLERRQRVKV